jgi:hypothetical protein
MPSSSDDDDVFRVARAPAALRQSVEQLSRDCSRSLELLDGLPLSAIYSLACETYGENLPEFWRIWKDWLEDDGIQPMGDL